MSQDTKERLLDAAECLFAERGYASTSLRDITSEARANLASVNYHFGGKEALLAAVFERRLRPVNEGRIRELDLLEVREGVPSLDGILWAYLAPAFREMQKYGRAGRRFMQLVGRTHADPSQPVESFLRQFEEVKARFHEAFCRALPHLEPDEVMRRMHFVVGAMAHTFVWCREVGCLCQSDEEPDRVLHSLVRFAADGMCADDAPVTEPAVPPAAAGGPS